MATATPFPQLESEPTPSLRLVTLVPFSARTESLAVRVRSVSSTNLDDFPVASELLESVLSLKTAVVKHHAEAKQKAYEAHQSACRTEHADLDPVLALEKQVKQIIAALESKRKQLEQEAELAARRAAEQASAEMQEQLIEAAEQSGASPAEVAALCHISMPVPVATPTPAVERPKGFTAADDFLVEVTDVAAFARDVVSGKGPLELLQPNLPLLKALTKASKGNLPLAGVKITRTLSVSGRKTK